MRQKASQMIIFITVFIDLVGFGMIIPLSPYLAREFQADALQIGLLMSIYSVMQFIFAPFWGQISDRVGRRPVVLVCLLGIGLSHFVFAMAQDLFVLFAARGLAGFFGANISTAMAYMADISEKKGRSKAMGLIGAAFGLGFILGPFLGGLLGHIGEMIGEAAPFGKSFAALGASILSLVNFVCAFWFLGESRPPEKRTEIRARYAGIKQMGQFFSESTRGSLLVMLLLHTLAMANMESSLFLFMDDEHGWTLLESAMGFALVGLLMAFTQGYLVRKLLPKWGEKKTMWVGLSLAFVGFFGMAFGYQLAIMCAAVTFLSVGVGLSNPAINGSLSLASSDQEQGSVMGVGQSMASLGRIIGPAVGGWLYRDFGHSSPFFMASALILFALILSLAMLKKLPQASLSASA